MARLLVTRLPRAAPEAFVRAAGDLLRRGGPEPALLLAPLAGEAILLGRWQRAGSALKLAEVRARGLSVVRRAGGGKALLAGEGALGVFLVVPPGAAFGPGPLAPDRSLLRTVRGLLAGLRAAGARDAAFFGRDFVSAGSRRVAAVSQEGTAAGATALEAVVAVGRDLAVPEPLVGYPPHADPRAGGPPPTTIRQLAGREVRAEDVAEAIARGFAAAAGLDPAPLAGPAPEEEVPAAFEDETGFRRSGVAEVPIGFVEALVRTAAAVPAGGPVRLLAARIRGDFMAPAFLVEHLEASLGGCPAAFVEVGRRVDAAFRLPGAFVQGLRERRILADALLAAALG